MGITKIYRFRPAKCHCTHARRSHIRVEWLGAPDWENCRYCGCVRYHVVPATAGDGGAQ